MKKFIFAAVVLVLLMVSIPFLSLGNSRSVTPTQETTSPTEQATLSTQQATTPTQEVTEETSTATQGVTKAEALTTPQDTTSITAPVVVYNTADKSTVTLERSDLICCMLASKMVPSYTEAAIKAFAIALNTQIQRETEENKDKDYNIQLDLSDASTYTEKFTLEKNWGNSFNDSYTKIHTAVTEVMDTFVTYNNELIDAKYFFTCAGSTNNSKDILSQDIPYLVSVPSPYDTLCASYTAKKTISTQDFNSILQKEWEDIEISENPEEIISNIQSTANGTVLTLTVANKDTTGDKVQALLGLKSSCFEIVYTKDEYLITCKGNGSGLGLSLYGANQMALQGADYKAILTHYYTGAVVK